MRTPNNCKTFMGVSQCLAYEAAEKFAVCLYRGRTGVEPRLASIGESPPWRAGDVGRRAAGRISQQSPMGPVAAARFRRTRHRRKTPNLDRHALCRGHPSGLEL